MPDHLHLLLQIPLKMSISYFVGYLKGKSSFIWTSYKFKI